MIGREKRERTLDPVARKRVAIHEAGHACMAFWLQDAPSPIKVSIVPRGASALGFSQSQPKTRYIQTEMEVKASIAVLFGGRVAERMVLGSVSTGAADDLERIHALSKKYFLSFGMGSRPVYHELPLEEHEHFLQHLESFVYDTLLRRKDDLITISEQLLQHETIEHLRLDGEHSLELTPHTWPRDGKSRATRTSCGSAGT